MDQRVRLLHVTKVLANTLTELYGAYSWSRTLET